MIKTDAETAKNEKTLLTKEGVRSILVSKKCEHSEQTLILLLLLCMRNTRNMLLISERCLCVKQKHFSISNGIVQSQLRQYRNMK